MAQPPASASDHRPQQTRSLLAGILTYALLVFWSLVCLFPLYWIAVTSLKGDPEIMCGPYYLPFVDFTPSLDAWGSVLDYANDHLLLRFFNSAVVAITSTLLTVLFGGLAVYGLTRFRYALQWIPGLSNDGILFAILATRILPPVAVVLPIYVMATRQQTSLLPYGCCYLFSETWQRRRRKRPSLTAHRTSGFF